LRGRAGLAAQRDWSITRLVNSARARAAPGQTAAVNQARPNDLHIFQTDTQIKLFGQ